MPLEISLQSSAKLTTPYNCRKDFRILVCFQVLYISSSYRIVFVYVLFFKYPFGPRKVYTLFVILWWSHVLNKLNFRLYYLCSAELTNHQEPSSPFWTSIEQLWTCSCCHIIHMRTNSLLSICWINGLVKLLGKKKRLNASLVQVFSIFFVYFIICKFVQTYKWFWFPDNWFLMLLMGLDLFGIDTEL